MQPSARFGIFLTLLALAPASAFSQQPPRDSMRMIMLPPPLQIDRAVVLALVTDSSVKPNDSRFAKIRGVADSFGFDFDVARLDHLQIMDRRYYALYTVPRDVRAGYFIIVPGHRPVILWSWVEPDSLGQRLARYRRLAGPLVAR
jgi:hypothetical protein